MTDFNDADTVYGWDTATGQFYTTWAELKVQLAAELPSSSASFESEETAAVAFVKGEVGYLSSGQIAKAKADAETTTKGLLFMAVDDVSIGAVGTFTRLGDVTVTAHGFTVGEPLYLSKDTGGAITNLPPSTSGSFIRLIGYATDANTIFFNAGGVWVGV